MSRTYNPTDLVDFLVLGAGWTSKFLVEQFEKTNLSYALTTTKGTLHKTCVGKYDGSNIISFQFDAAQEDESAYHNLPDARTVIVTFKLDGRKEAKRLVETYNRTHAGSNVPNWLLLGSTSIWPEKRHYDCGDDYKKTDRALAEEEFMSKGGVVLNLAGLWGDDRKPWGWPYQRKIVISKDQLREKASLHLIHGEDVARACIMVGKSFTASERWLLSDNEVYDWWDLIDGWADELSQQARDDGQTLQYKKWVAELMVEEGLQALPRDRVKLGRALNSSHFWQNYESSPTKFLSRNMQTSIANL